MNTLLSSPAIIAGPGGRLPPPRAEAALLAVIRQRIESQLRGGDSGRVSWVRDEHCAGRDDLRAKVGLSRSALDRLPSGRTLHGQISRSGWLPPEPVGIAVVVTASWQDLSRGGEGAVSVAEAIEHYEVHRAAWRIQHGAAPFYAAVAGRLTEQEPRYSCPGLALIAWEDGHWQLCPPAGDASAVETLFYPRSPADCAAEIEIHLDAGTGAPRLATAVAAELGLPFAVVVNAGEKNLRRHALEYRSGQPLFFRS